MRSQGLVSTLAGPFCLCALLLISSSSTHADAARPQSRIICRQDLSQARREELADKLRAITGWPDLAFDENGSLQPGTKAPVGGSETARTLLATALSGPNVLILEDASKRKGVVFCKLIPGQWKKADFDGPPVYVVLIDFADFDYLIGDRPALNAFNAGWGFLHEIDHVVNDSIDPQELGRAGDCEAHINQMRRELNLPERSDYFFTYFPHARESGFSTRFVRLPFDQKRETSNKFQRYWVMWDATMVGGLSEVRQIAGLRPGY